MPPGECNVAWQRGSRAAEAVEVSGMVADDVLCLLLHQHLKATVTEHSLPKRWIRYLHYGIC